MSVDKLRETTASLIKSTILEIESFLLYVKENIKNEKLSKDDIRNLSLVYHRLWWFRDKLVQQYYPSNGLRKYPPSPTKEHLKAAKLDLEILLSRNPKLASNVSIPKVFEKDIENAAALIGEKLNVTNTAGSRPIIRLEINGELCFGDENCYQMSKKDRRYKLVKYLSENKGPHTTKFLTEKFGYTSVKAAGSDISRLNAKIEGKISLKKFIDNLKPDGYCINKDYFIAVIKK